MARLRTPIVLLLAICAVASCVRTRPAPTGVNVPPVNMDAAAIIARIQAHPVPSSMRAVADLSLQSPFYLGSMTARLSHRRGDSLLVTLAARGLGIQAGRLLVTRDSFFFYNRLAREVTEGAGGDLLPGLFGVENAMVRLLGLIVPDPVAAWEVQVSGTGYLLQDTVRGLAYHVDANRWRVITMEDRLPSGELVETLHFSEFSPFDGVSYPRRITYHNRFADTAAQLYIRSLVFKGEIGSMRLDVPPDAVRVTTVPPG